MQKYIMSLSIALFSGNATQAATQAATVARAQGADGQTPQKSSLLAAVAADVAAAPAVPAKQTSRAPVKTIGTSDIQKLESKVDSQRKAGSIERGKQSKPHVDGFNGYFSSVKLDEKAEAKLKADGLRITTIKTISDILRTSKPKGERKFELTLRLAEMLLERHDYLRELEYEKFQKTWDLWSKTHSPDDQKQQPTPNNNESKKELQNAIAVLRSVVTEFPNNPKTSTALYVLGQSLLLNNNDMAETYLLRLTKSFPNSSDFPDACLALGEFYFEKQRMIDAKEFYKKTLAFKDHKAIIYALYKYSWTLYNLGHANEAESEKLFDQSLASMKLVIKFTDKDKSNLRNLNLRREAINDLIIIWADAGKVDDALAYFKDIKAEEKFYDLLDRLAHIYGDQGKKQEALALYNRILSEAPLRTRNIDVHKSIVELSENGVEFDKLAEAIRRMNEFVKPNSPWHKAQERVFAQKSVEDVEQLTRFYGTKFHKISQKSKNVDYAKAAVKIYATYIGFFPENPSTYEIRFYFADLMFTLGQYELAAKNFLMVAQSKKYDQYRHDASINAVAASEELLNKDGINNDTVAPAEKALPLPGQITLWKACVESHLKMYPADPLAPDMLLALSSTLFRYGHKSEAITWFEKLASSFPSTTQGKKAMKFVIVYRIEVKDYDLAYTQAGSYVKLKEIKDDSELLTFLALRIRESAFGKGLALEERQKFFEAGEHFASFQKLYPKDEIADKALYNAITNYFKVGQVAKVVASSETLIKQYPSSKLRPEIMANLANTQENMAEFQSAEQAYMSFATSYPNDSRARLALINSARLRRGLGMVSEARSAYLMYMRSWPNDPVNSELQLELAYMLENSSDKNLARDAWQAVFNSSHGNAARLETELTAEAHLISLHEKPSNAARDLASKLRTTKVRALEARGILGKFLFSQAKNEIEEFQNKTSLEPKNLEASIVAKNEKLIQITKKLVRIAEVSDPEYSIAAQVVIGDLHKAFSDSLMTFQPPAALPAQEIEAIKNDLEKLAQPLQAEAHNFYKNGWKISEEIPSFSKWSQVAYERMGMVEPEKFKSLKIETIAPSYLGHRLPLNDYTESLGI